MPRIWNYKTYVAGASFRQDQVARCREGQAVELTRDPDNEHDSNAIEVWAGSGQIGFIPQDTAETWAEWMDAGDKFDASIRELNPPERGKEFIGVTIEVLVTPGPGRPGRYD